MSEETLRSLREFTPSTNEGGTVSGVGLRLVQSVISAANGSVQVSSEIERGTEVCLILPTAEPQPAVVG